MPKEKENNKLRRKRATEEKRKERSRSIESLMDKGYKPAEIAQALCHRYSISLRQAERDIKAVKIQRSKYLLLNSPHDLRAEHYHALSHIYQDSLQKGDTSTALKALELKDKLLDKHADIGGIPNEPVSDSSKTTPEDLEALLEMLEEESPE